MRHDYLIVVCDGETAVAVHLLPPSEAGPYVAAVRRFWPDLTVSCEPIQIVTDDAPDLVATGSRLPVGHPQRPEGGFRSWTSNGGKWISGRNSASGGKGGTERGEVSFLLTVLNRPPHLLHLRTDLAVVGAAGFEDEDDDEQK